MIAFEVHAINSKIRALKSRLRFNESLYKLLSSRSAEEVAIHIFPDFLISKGGINVHTDFEIKLYSKAIDDFKKLIRFSRSLKPLLLNLIRKFEIANLKKIVKGIIYPRYKEQMRFHDISPYSSFNPAKALECNNLDELSEFLSKTRYKNIIVPDKNENKAFLIENRLDIFHYDELLGLSSKMFGKSKGILINFFQEEINYTNLLWAIRLKRYYNLKFDDLSKYIISHDKLDVSLKQYEPMFDAQYEDEILVAIPKKNRIKIERMYFKHFNKEIDYENTTLIEIEICINKILKDIYLHFLYDKYLSIAPILSFFKLKYIEINNLNTIVEGYRFNLTKDEISHNLI